jgi:hypothetical protein
MVVVDRTTYIEQALEAIKQGEHSLPWKDDSLSWVLDEFCALNSSEESDMNSNRPIRGQQLTKYGRDGDDHALHALIYARIASEFADEGEGFEIRTFGA